MATRLTPNEADVKVVQTMIDAMVGIPKFSYPARQNNAPKPQGEYAHVRVIEEYQVGVPTQTITAQTVDTTTYTIYGCVRIRVRVGVVDTTGIPSMKIMNGWTTEQLKAIMIKTGYGFIKCTPLSSEDAKLEKEWEYRKGFALELYVTREFTEVVDNITKVTLRGEFIPAFTDDILIINN